MEPISSIRRYYFELDVEPGVSPAELKEAYRALVKQWHPDRHAHDTEAQREAEERTKVINEAYAKLRQYRRDMQPGARHHTGWTPVPNPMRPAARPSTVRPPAPSFSTPPTFDHIDSTFFQAVDLDDELTPPPSYSAPRPSPPSSSSRPRPRKLKGPMAALATVALALVLGLGVGGFTGWLVGGTEAITNGAVAMGSLLATIAAVVGGMGLFVNGR